MTFGSQFGGNIARFLEGLPINLLRVVEGFLDFTIASMMAFSSSGRFMRP